MSTATTIGRLVLPALIALSSWAMIAPTAQAQPQAPKSEFRLSELSPVPREDQWPTWLELCNQGQDPVKVCGWCLSDATGAVYAFPPDMKPVPAHAFVLLIFSSATTPLPPNLNAARDCIKLYAGATFRQFIRGNTNECALYAAATPAADKIIDFIAWGGTTTLQSTWALQAQVVLHESWLVAMDTEIAPQKFGISDGITIGRGPVWPGPPLTGLPPRIPRPARTGDWGLYAENDPTPGSANPYSPPFVWDMSVQCKGADGEGVDSFVYYGPANFVAPGGISWIRVQVATDTEFTKIVLDACTKEGRNYEHKPNLPPGTYYWRARGEAPYGLTTLWSHVAQFEERETKPAHQ